MEDIDVKKLNFLGVVLILALLVTTLSTSVALSAPSETTLTAAYNAYYSFLKEAVDENARLNNPAKETAADIIASGGVTDIKDIQNLAALGVAGVICGKSIYKGTLSLKDALQYQNHR